MESGAFGAITQASEDNTRSVCVGGILIFSDHHRH